MRKANALETLSIMLKCILVHSFAGWEVMEIFAGGVSQSDAVFMVRAAINLSARNELLNGGCYRAGFHRGREGDPRGRSGAR